LLGASRRRNFTGSPWSALGARTCAGTPTRTLVALPFTDLKGLRTNLGINPSDFLFLEYTNLANFPFLKDFAGPVRPDGFQLLYRKDTPANGRLELYRVLPNATAAAARSTP
jgi:hypothetical protein